MPRFLIEVPHDSDQLACNRAIKVLLETGSHFLTHAEWGCKDGCHSAWLTVDVESRDEARAILPPAYRGDARIILLTRFNLADVDRALERLQTRS